MNIAELGKRLQEHHVAILICLFLFAPGTVRGEQLPIRTYTTADGLARDQINRIVLDSRGFLWFCTGEGLSRFDGYSFRTYTTDQGLPPRSVNDLLETRQGDYWVATSDGIARFNPTVFSEAGANSGNQSSSATNSVAPKANAMFVIYRPEDEEAARHVNVLFEDPAGKIWCGTNRGMYRLEQIDKRVSFRFVDFGMPKETYGDTIVNAIVEDRRGTLWVGTQGSGLYRHWPDGHTDRYTTRNGLPENLITALLEDSEARLWVGTRQGLCELVAEPNLIEPIVARIFTTEDGLPASNHIESICQSSDGTLWVGSYGGLSQFVPIDKQSNQTFRTYTTAQGLNGSGIGALAEDRDGNIWMAGDGAMKLARTGFTSFTEADGIGDPVIASIFENHAGELYVVSSALTDKFIHQFDGHKFTTIRPNIPRSVTYFGWGWNQITFQDHLGEWWVVTGHGLYRFAKVNRVEQLAHARPKAVYTSKDGLFSDEIFRLDEDSRGDIWIVSVSATQHGLTRWERATETFHNYSGAGELPPILSALITAFCEDASGNLWVATNASGLARYAERHFTPFTTSDGVPAGWIRALHLDRSGRLWIASSQSGLSYIEDPKADRPRFISYTTADGLSSNDVWCITEDRWGRIYAGTGRGVDRLDPATGHVKHYTTADGLAKGELQVAFRDRQGALWFGTSQGLSRLVPTLDQPESPPPILISGLRIAGFRYPMSELGTTAVAKLELGPNDNQVQIDFIGIGFGSSGTLHYQYLLEGADRDWSALTDERTVNYASLRPGNYRFLVRAVTAGGVTSVSPATVAFTILPPIWQRWWVITLLALTIGLAGYSLFRYRVARLLELERMRTRIATDLHDDIGSSLSQVSVLSEVIRRRIGHDPNVSEPLSVIASLSRDLVDSMSDIVWAINPRRDRLSDLTQRMRRFASDVFTARQIEFTFQAPDAQHDLSLGADTRREVFMIFKESINNTIRHSGCSEATINFLVEDGVLELRLHDNGRGFDPQQANEGNGLASMRQRATKLGGGLTLISGNGNGTTVTLRAPVERSGRFWRRLGWPRR